MRNRPPLVARLGLVTAAILLIFIACLGRLYQSIPEHTSGGAGRSSSRPGSTTARSSAAPHLLRATVGPAPAHPTLAVPVSVGVAPRPPRERFDVDFFNGRPLGVGTGGSVPASPPVHTFRGEASARLCEASDAFCGLWPSGRATTTVPEMLNRDAFWIAWTGSFRLLGPRAKRRRRRKGRRTRVIRFTLQSSAAARLFIDGRLVAGFDAQGKKVAVGRTAAGHVDTVDTVDGQIVAVGDVDKGKVGRTRTTVWTLSLRYRLWVDADADAAHAVRFEVARSSRASVAAAGGWRHVAAGAAAPVVAGLWWERDRLGLKMFMYPLPRAFNAAIAGANPKCEHQMFSAEVVIHRRLEADCRMVVTSSGSSSSGGSSKSNAPAAPADASGKCEDLEEDEDEDEDETSEVTARIRPARGVRTLNPWAADLFFVPAYTACKQMPAPYFGVDPWFGRRNLVEALNHVRATWPMFWHRRHGRDHVVMATYDYGACFEYKRTNAKQAGLPTIVRNVHILQTLGDVSLPQCFRAAQDVPLPAFVDIVREAEDDAAGAGAGVAAGAGAGAAHDKKDDAEAKAWSGAAAGAAAVGMRMGGHSTSKEERPVLVHFQGSIEWFDKDPDYSNGVRKRMVDALLARHRGDPRYLVAGGHKASKAAYVADMRRSVFCLCPLGFAPWTPRMMESLLYGCIPVLVADHVRMPFHWPSHGHSTRETKATTPLPASHTLLDWTTFSVKIREADVGRLDDILAAITPQEIAAMQRALRRARRAVAYTYDSPRGAFTMLMRELALRFGMQPGPEPESPGRNSKSKGSRARSGSGGGSGGGGSGGAEIGGGGGAEAGSWRPPSRLADLPEAWPAGAAEEVVE